jgi:hypothetical protein
MQRIDTPNRALNLWGAGKDGWKDGNQSAGVNATELDAAFFNAVQEELAAFPEYVGKVLDPNNRGQVLAAVLTLIEARAGNYALDTGVANAYVVALNPAVAVIAGDYTFRVKIVHANTGASTVDFGAGPIGLFNDLGGALVANDLPAASVISVSYILADNKAYVTSLVQSQAISQAQADARYSPFAAGHLIMHTGASAPAGYLQCPTAPTNISRATYAALFAAIGTTWGAGDGVTTFGMPYFFPGGAPVHGITGIGSTTPGSVISHTHADSGHNHTQNPHTHADSGHIHGLTTMSAGGGAIDTYTEYATASVLKNLGTSTNAASAAIQNATATNNAASAAITATGGAANYAAGVTVMMCVKY